MRHWHTKDRPTDANLGYMESLARPDQDITAERYTDKIRALIRLEEMLPAAVRTHFSFPPLIIGDRAYHWDAARLAEADATLCSALSAGLQAAFADPALGPDGDSDFSDRPPTRGEEILAAIEAYREFPGSSNLDDLRVACDTPGMTRRFDALMRWRARKRPSSPDRPLAYEIASALGDIRRYAADFHHVRASHRYADRAGT